MLSRASRVFIIAGIGWLGLFQQSLWACSQISVGPPLTSFGGTGYQGATFAASPGDMCSCGITVPAGVALQGVTLRRPDGTVLINFAPNAAASSAYQANTPAPSGQSWVGLSGTLLQNTSAGEPAILVFVLAGNNQTFQPLVGAGEANPDGTPNFGGSHPVSIFLSDPIKAPSSIPLMSAWGWVALALLLAIGGSVLARRQRTVGGLGSGRPA